jgi:hypothetical protein
VYRAGADTSGGPVLAAKLPAASGVGKKGSFAGSVIWALAEGVAAAGAVYRPRVERIAFL